MTTRDLARNARIAIRDFSVPADRLLAKARIRTPQSATSAARETVGVGSVPTSVAVLGVAVVVALISSASGAYYQTVVGTFCAYLVGALSYNLILGYAGQFAFCQNAFMAIGAYGFAVAAPRFGVPVAVLIGLGAALVSGVAIGLAVLRTSEIYLALLTLAFSQAVILAIQVWPPTQGDNGISTLLSDSAAYLLAIVAAAVVVLFMVRLIRSPFGRRLALIRTDETAATAMGVDVPRTRVVVFAIGSLLGGLAGILLAGTLTFVTPTNFTLELTLLLLTMVVVGGTGSVWGTVVGVLIIVLVREAIPGIGSGGAYIDAGLLFVILLLRPSGLRSLLSLRSRGFADAH